MTEEVVVDKVVEPVVEAEKTVEPSVSEPSPVEQQAMEQGWVPLEDWTAAGKSEKEWRPAKEFVERGELYKSIHSTKRELKQTQAALTALQKHHQYVFEKAHQQALNELKKEKRQAIRNEDFERLEEVETEIEQLQEERTKEVQVFQQAQAAAQEVAAPAFQLFVDKNQWYLTDKQLRDEADAAGFIYLNNGGNREGLFTHVEKEMRRKFPEKFGVRKAAPSAVAGVDRTRGKGPKADSVELTAEERKVMMTFVNQGIMTEAEYLKELKKVGR